MTTVGRWSPNKVRARVLDGTWVSTEELGGMVLLTPTSVDITGSGSETATTTANGSVEFAACTSISLNGVFSADYDNYMIDIKTLFSVSGGSFLNIRLRASETDDTISNSYVTQYLDANGTSVSGARVTSNIGYFGYIRGTAGGLIGGDTGYIYGPYLSQPTAWRAVDTSPLTDAFIRDCAGTHNQPTAYDGFTFSVTSPYAITGLVSVYGLVGA